MIKEEITDGVATPWSLEKILGPCRPEDFFASSWGKTYQHVVGWPGKFSGLLPWNALNEILRRHRLDYPRLRLMRDGARLPVSSYLRHTQNARTKTTIPRLRPAELTKHLREGATLVMDAVDELSRPVEELAENLELLFHERVQVNMYAGWQTSRGFDLHWDDHDVFILQVAGRKRWRIYGETRPHPVTGDASDKPPDSDAPLWEATLEDGDLLYLPRGFWHVALPLAEPTLHLTVGVHNRTGLDLLRFVMERLRRDSASFRQDLPRFGSIEEQQSHLAGLREELLSVFDSHDLLSNFLEEADAVALPRAHLSLPWSATAETLPAGADVRVRFLAPRPLKLCAENGVVEFSCLNKHWRFALDAALVLRPLIERRVCTVAELCAAARARLDEQRVRAFLSELVREGLVAVVED